MKVLLFIVFTILGLYAYFDMFEFANEQKEKIEVINEKATLAEKIRIPQGMEKEYSLILAGKSPFQNQGNNITVGNHNKTENKINNIEKFENKKSKLSEITKIAVGNINVENRNLKIDIKVYNESNKDINGFTLSCNVTNESNSHIGDLSFNVTDTLIKKDFILIKNVELELMDDNPSNINCEIN